MKTKIVKLRVPEKVNLILGQSHFIKTVEDIYETLISSSPYTKFGIAFCESSGPALIRYDGNDEELIKLSIEYVQKISSGHAFIILLKDTYPINVLN